MICLIELLDLHIQKNKVSFKNAIFVVILQVKAVEITEKTIYNANNTACSSRHIVFTVFFVLEN